MKKVKGEEAEEEIYKSLRDPISIMNTDLEADTILHSGSPECVFC